MARGAPRSPRERVLSREEVEARVRAYFKDIPIMIRIAACESEFRQFEADGSVLRGRKVPSDVGVMQINERYHGAAARRMGLDLTRLEDNLAYARYLYRQKGTAPWRASAACWGGEVVQR